MNRGLKIIKLIQEDNDKLSSYYGQDGGGSYKYEITYDPELLFHVKKIGLSINEFFSRYTFKYEYTNSFNNKLFSTLKPIINVLKDKIELIITSYEISDSDLQDKLFFVKPTISDQEKYDHLSDLKKLSFDIETQKQNFIDYISKTNINFETKTYELDTNLNLSDIFVISNAKNIFDKYIYNNVNISDEKKINLHYPLQIRNVYLKINDEYFKTDQDIYHDMFISTNTLKDIKNEQLENNTIIVIRYNSGSNYMINITINNKYTLVKSLNIEYLNNLKRDIARIYDSKYLSDKLVNEFFQTEFDKNIALEYDKQYILMLLMEYTELSILYKSLTKNISDRPDIAMCLMTHMRSIIMRYMMCLESLISKFNRQYDSESFNDKLLSIIYRDIMSENYITEFSKYSSYI